MHYYLIIVHSYEIAERFTNAKLVIFHINNNPTVQLQSYDLQNSIRTLQIRRIKFGF